MENFREELKELPEWFKDGNRTLKIGKYQAELNTMKSGINELFYEIKTKENTYTKVSSNHLLLNDVIARLYIYFDGFSNANFANLNPETAVAVEDAKNIIKYIVKKFNLPISCYSYHTKKSTPPENPDIDLGVANCEIINAENGMLGSDENIR